MEKLKPHYPLEEIRQAVTAGKVRMTYSAVQGAHALGMLEDDVWGVLLRLTPREFYKSMTTHHNHRIWQDVYHAPHEGRLLYIKIQDVGGYLLVSFKEK